MTIDDENYKNVMILLNHGIVKADSRETFKIINNVFMLLGGQGVGKIDIDYLEKIKND